MVRLITAFACALVANADYICTTTAAADCQCLTMIDPALDDQLTGPRTVWLMAPGAENGQSDFTVTDADRAISYKFPDGQELCVTHPDDGDGDFHPPTMAPCDYGGEGGFFLLEHRTDGLLFHIGKLVHDSSLCLEPNETPLLSGGFLADGECSSSWTISRRPQCYSKGEMVIA